MNMEAAAPSATGGRQGARVVIDQWLSGWVGLALLGLAALALRLFELGRNPFWLDELSTYQISLQSPGAIIQYAWHDPWPPLYYLAVKLASGFGLVHAEWAWRILSVGAGTLAVVGMYWLLGKLSAGPPPCWQRCWSPSLPRSFILARKPGRTSWSC